MYLLSVVIPIYNVEKFIEKSICSIIDEGLKNIEIILINDGSPDDSGRICERYAQSNSNVKYIKQINKGLSGARNTGIINSTGKYIAFLDGDDFIEQNSLKKIIYELENEELDVLLTDCNYYWSENQKYRKRNLKTSKVITGIKIMEDLFQKKKFLPMAWLNIYNREFLFKKELLFYEGLLHEDTEFTPRSLMLATKVKYLNCIFVNYVQREGTITSTPNFKRNYDLLRSSESLINFNYRHKNKYLNNYINYLSFEAISGLTNKNDDYFDQSLFLFEKIKPYKLKNTLPKYILLGHLKNISFSMFQVTMRLVKRRSIR